jgi:hypothetical protein
MRGALVAQPLVLCLIIGPFTPPGVGVIACLFRR